MTPTFTGLAVLGIAFFLFISKGLGFLVLVPYGMICFSYLRFFGVTDYTDEAIFWADMANLLGFGIFSFAFWVEYQKL